MNILNNISNISINLPAMWYINNSIAYGTTHPDYLNVSVVGKTIE